MYSVLYSQTVEAHHTHHSCSTTTLCSSSHPHVCVPVFMSWLSARCRDNSEVSGSVCVMSHPISASILGPVFGNQDQFVGLAIFVDTFRNDLHGMDVSVCVVPLTRLFLRRARVFRLCSLPRAGCVYRYLL